MPDELEDCAISGDTEGCETTVLTDFEVTPVDGCDSEDDFNFDHDLPPPEEDCCVVPSDVDEIIQNDWQSAGADIVAEVLADCGSEIVQFVQDPDCTPVEPEWGDLVPDGEFSVHPLADLVLTLATGSFIDITSPVDNEVFSVSGGGSVRLTPNGFLSALIWAEDGTLGNHDLTDWRFWMAVPVAIDLVSGQFDIDAVGENVFFGSGYDDSTSMGLELDMGEDAFGSIDTVTDTWDLDFSESASGWTVEIHLEGSFTDAP
jgi:hypothetical protein